MRSMWSGYLGFGLVQMPMKLYKATESHDIGFKQIHDGCGGHVGHMNVCKDCGATPERDEIAKGVEHEGQLVILDVEDIDQLREEQGKQIDILQFVKTDEVPPLMYEASYYIGAPDGQKVYALLVDAMERSGLIAIAQFTMRSSTRLAAIRVVEGVLCLHTLCWPDELRPPEVPGLGKSFSAAEAKAARAVVQSMVKPFDPDEHHDLFTERLGELIEARAGDIEFTMHETPEAVAEVDDLLAALQASVQNKKQVPKKSAKAAPKKAAARKARVA